MKLPGIVACCTLSIITLGAVAFAVHSSTQSTKLRQQWQIESKASKAKLSNLTELTELNQQLIAELEQIKQQFAVTTNRLHNQLVAANDKIHDYEIAAQARPVESSDKKMVVPPPVISAGNPPVYYFAKVVGSGGNTLMTDANFVRVFGRKLIFKSEAAINTYDVDEVHPEMLQYLEVNADDAKEKQRQMDSALKSKAQSDKIFAAQAAQTHEARRIADAQLAVEKQKADAAASAALAAAQQADADKAQAEADKALARAAALNAVKPQPSVNVIQQQVQQQGYYRNGIWYPY